MKIAIWDLDNCLADDRWRIEFIDWAQTNPDKRYDKYHMLCGQDAPGNVSLFAAVSAQATPVFCTARPECVRGTTVRWLRNNLPQHHASYASLLLMRATGDHLPSVRLKHYMLTTLRAQGHTIAAAFDDREDVVRMYREHGVAAARLWIHDVCAMTPPPRMKEATNEHHL